MLIDDVVNDPETALIAVHPADQITDIMHLAGRTGADNVDKVLAYVMRQQFWLQIVFFRLLHGLPDKARCLNGNPQYMAWLKKNVKIITDMHA